MAPSDRSDALVLTLRFVDGRGQRLVVEPGSEDPRGEHTLVDKRLTKGGTFDAKSSDPLDAIAVENALPWASDSDEPLLQVRRHLRAIIDGEDADYHARNALQHLDHTEVWL